VGFSRMYLLRVIYRDGSRSVVEEVVEEDLVAVVFDQLDKLRLDRNIERITVKLLGGRQEVSESR